MTIKPLLLTQAHIEKYYNITPEQAGMVVQDLRPVGAFLREDNPLFQRDSVEAKLKELDLD